MLDCILEKQVVLNMFKEENMVLALYAIIIVAALPVVKVGGSIFSALVRRVLLERLGLLGGGEESGDDGASIVRTAAIKSQS